MTSPMTTPMTTSMTTTRQVCTFTLDDLHFGIDVHSIQEVLRYHEMTAIPLAPPGIRGLINLRGQIVVAIDMRARLALAPSAELPMNVVVRRGDDVVSLLVDAIGDVLQVEDRAVERAPETVPGALRDVVTGIYKLERRLLLMLDLARVLEPQGIHS